MWKSWSTIISLDILQDITELYIIVPVKPEKHACMNHSTKPVKQSQNQIIYRALNQCINLLLFINP